MVRQTFHLLTFAFLALPGFYACHYFGEDNKRSKEVIAQVYDRRLYLKDFPEELTRIENKEDSIALSNAFVEQWIRKTLLLHEAEKFKPKSLDIEKLLQDYKESLLINSFQRQIITSQMDTLVSVSEVRELYDNLKGNFILEYPVIRFSLVKIPHDAPNIDKFYAAWKSNDRKITAPYIKKYAVQHLDFSGKWIEWNQTKKQLDSAVLRNVSFEKKSTIQKKIGSHEYFIKIVDFVDKNEISPLSYIEDHLVNIVVQKRKAKVIEQYIEQLYEKESNQNNIRIFKK
ncbi:MAG TPA: hypothetical protein DCX89_02960 [Saprospirales bacterium]|nr:hypothetical protein [Saprospirales bacterium]HAY70826.1 hypothetical protein [Saprospirales bacterium]HRQ29650.1 hypothetical protein [Saprospiraceae bacterium]